MAYVIGIDLGTTNSVVACLESSKPQVMQNAEGGKTTPSVVLYPRDGEPVVGEMAKRQRLMQPARTIYSVKRFVGCRWDESEERRAGIDYPLEEGPDGLICVNMDGRTLLPETVQAEVLKKMKKTAEDYLGEAVTQAVITCPAYFNDSQRQATKKAAEQAGLEALRIINEPTAAALAYGLGRKKNGRVAVFDFGGGTFDISILDLDDGVFEVKATCGDTCLGGDSIDTLLRQWILAQILEKSALDLTADASALARVAEAAEKAKCELSTMEKTVIALPFIGANESGPKHFNAQLPREQLEELMKPVIERLVPPCRQALADAQVTASQLDAVILVGGSTRIPAVRRLVAELFGREPDHSVNPDEAVAVGAAIQAGVMRGDLDEILLLDVTPLSLGIEVAGGVFSPLIPRNSNIPTTARKKFTTVRDNQPSVRIHVMQGERKIARENRSLAHIRLEGILPAPREVPEIEVSFNIDANGILNVSAMDLTSGKLQEVRVESYMPVGCAENDRLLEEATRKAEEDRIFMRKAAVRRHVEEMRLELAQFQSRNQTELYDEKQEERMRQAIFRLDVALQQDDFSLIDQAEREARSKFAEIMMLAGFTSAFEGGLGEELIIETGDNHKREKPEPRPVPAAVTVPAAPQEDAPGPPPEPGV